jgi:ubiquinone/menaquinone biosynthesis C-methylase UbiE
VAQVPSGGKPSCPASGILPARHILEIAHGHGRWTQFLADQCDALTLIELSAECLAVCRERFRERSHLRCHVNDGRSLRMVADRSIDFAFSFDSLVHVELPVLEAYLHELARVLTPDGVASCIIPTLGPTARLVSRAGGCLTASAWS